MSENKMKFDVVKLGDNRYGVKVRYYEWGIKLFTEYIKLYKDAMLTGKPYEPDKQKKWVNEKKCSLLSKKTCEEELDEFFKDIKLPVPAPLTKKLPSKNDKQYKKTEFENIYSGTKEQCIKLYGELIDNDSYLYESILTKFEGWDTFGGFKMGTVCFVIFLYIILAFYVHYL